MPYYSMFSRKNKRLSDKKEEKTPPPVCGSGGKKADGF